MNRRWLVEETGEVRCPQVGEMYRDNDTICPALINYMGCKFPILRVTELPVTTDGASFDEWNR